MSDTSNPDCALCGAPVQDHHSCFGGLCCPTEGRQQVADDKATVSDNAMKMLVLNIELGAGNPIVPILDGFAFFEELQLAGYIIRSDDGLNGHVTAAGREAYEKVAKAADIARVTILMRALGKTAEKALTAADKCFAAGHEDAIAAGAAALAAATTAFNILTMDTQRVHAMAKEEPIA